MGKYFGTDGVRGVANTELTCALAMRLGQAGAQVLSEAAHTRPRILIGRDPRASGDMLSCALIAGICSVGAHAIDVGVMTTPGVAYLTRALGLDAGAIISASHNPVQDNGIKFFSGRGYKLSDALEDKIEALLPAQAELPAPVGGDIGRLERMTDAQERYLTHLESLMPHSLASLCVVLDCANGAASAIAPELFTRLGAKVHVIHGSPDGLNINKNCGSTHPEDLQRAVLEHGADVGFAFDGDADRLISVDAQGRIVDGDSMMAILAENMKNQGKLTGNTLVATVMSNMGLEIFLRERGINMVRTAVGDRYVLEEMLEHGYALGGEQSGHIIFHEQATTGDGIVSALNLLRPMLEEEKTLEELAGELPNIPQVLINVPVSNGRKSTLLEDLRIRSRIEAIEQAMQGRGRVLVRPSGTEALVRIMIEGPQEQTIRAYAQELAELMGD